MIQISLERNIIIDKQSGKGGINFHVVYIFVVVKQTITVKNLQTGLPNYILILYTFSSQSSVYLFSPFIETSCDLRLSPPPHNHHLPHRRWRIKTCYAPQSVSLPYRHFRPFITRRIQGREENAREINKTCWHESPIGVLHRVHPCSQGQE